jgi:hypothetical protein
MNKERKDMDEQRLNAASSSARHQWLEQAVTELRPRFTAAGYQVPNNIRVSIGFTKYTAWQHTIGQCWSAKVSSDQHTEKILLNYRKQTTRMVKCECATCHYPVRTTRLWIESQGAPHCPAHGTMLVCETV